MSRAVYPVALPVPGIGDMRSSPPWDAQDEKGPTTVDLGGVDLSVLAVADVTVEVRATRRAASRPFLTLLAEDSEGALSSGTMEPETDPDEAVGEFHRFRLRRGLKGAANLASVARLAVVSSGFREDDVLSYGALGAEIVRDVPVVQVGTSIPWRS